MRPALVGILNTYGFIPDTVEFLVIAGGGGTTCGAGGGGAGGYLSSVIGDNSGDNSTSLSTLSPVKNTAYTVTVGGGGSGGQLGSSNGTNSVFASYTAIGGGRSRYNGAGLSGGSGGGGGAALGSYGGGSGTANQGNAGGSGVWTSNDRAGGGGGGGASANGRTAYMIQTNPFGNFYGDGDGGAGQASSIISSTLSSAQTVGEVSGSSVYFGGGGGGGGRDAGTFGMASGGIGGGGDASNGGVNSGNGYPGDPNTGGGGGSTDYESSPQHYGGAGGSGVVILRYDSGGNTPTVSAGLTYIETIDQGYKVLIFKSGSGTITWD